MSLKIAEYNNVFNAFVKFAQKNMAADNEKAIAAANIRPLKGRNILSIKKASNDSVHNWTRGIDEWILNDHTRKLFKKAVADMFGGEGKIPESVKKAMILDDYNQGKPLTARRIIAVKQAIDVYKGDMQPLKLSLAKATTMIADARRRLFPVLDTDDIDEETLACAAEWLKKYGSGMPAKTIRVLANYIVNSMFDNGLDEEDIERVAKDMKGWREFDFGDKRLTKLGEKFTQRCNDYMKLQLTKPRNYMQNDPNIFSQLYGDANRGNWRIGNTSSPLAQNLT